MSWLGLLGHAVIIRGWRVRSLGATPFVFGPCTFPLEVSGRGCLAEHLG